VTVSLLSRVAGAVVALVLAVAAAAKLGRPDATAGELASLGLAGSERLARLVPIVELAIAGALLVAPAWGGVVAFALLSAFTAVLVRVIRSGRAVTCACFGGISRRPVSAVTVARNAVLLAMAAVAAAG
jgi:hypothetical protein